MKRRWLAAFVLVAVALPVLAQAPKALTIFVNGYALQGKALWYKGRIYVPLEDVAKSTGGTFNYVTGTGTAQATVGAAGVPAPTAVVPATTTTTTVAPAGSRPYLKVVYERKYTTGNVAKVLATVVNQGQLPAGNIEVICTFKDGLGRELTSQLQPAGNLNPGESRTLEFSFVGYGFGPPLSPGYGQEDHLWIDGHWTRISYALKFNYQ